MWPMDDKIVLNYSGETFRNVWPRIVSGPDRGQMVGEMSSQ